MKLVDTSAWIDQLRKNGDPTVRGRVEALLSSGEAAWCPIVRLELWNGARGQQERSVLFEMEKDIPSLDFVPEVWDRAAGLARSARVQGVTVPTTDLLVAACAAHHGVALEHNDGHFPLIESLSATCR